MRILVSRLLALSAAAASAAVAVGGASPTNNGEAATVPKITRTLVAPDAAVSTGGEGETSSVRRGGGWGVSLWGAAAAPAEEVVEPVARVAAAKEGKGRSREVSYIIATRHAEKIAQQDFNIYSRDWLDGRRTKKTGGKKGRKARRTTSSS